MLAIGTSGSLLLTALGVRRLSRSRNKRPDDEGVPALIQENVTSTCKLEGRRRSTSTFLLRLRSSRSNRYRLMTSPVPLPTPPPPFGQLTEYL